MVTNNISRHIRCCNPPALPGGNVTIVNRGAQFRHGLDSQYGDVVFVMKRHFWRSMNGTDYHGHEILPYPTLGHFYKRDFVQYHGEGNVYIADRWMEKDARLYSIRPPTYELSGKECKHREWNMSWCNLQLHLGQNVDFTHVHKVYVPAWIIYDHATMDIAAKKGLNSTLLRALVTNTLPFFPTGDNARNPLNGKFSFYGPKSADAHYHMIRKTRSKIIDSGVSRAIYSHICPPNTSYTIQTNRVKYGTSSPLYMNEVSFTDLELKYIADLVANNMTSLPIEEEIRVRQMARFYSYEQ
jgi:hypothetical protein